MHLRKDWLWNRELSWLSFNERVLQEAEDPSVPPLERLRFLGIFSSNLDEFFRIRVAGVKKIFRYNRKAKMNGIPVSELLDLIHDEVLQQQIRFEKVYNELLKNLRKKHLYFLQDSRAISAQKISVESYFKKKILPSLFPVMLNKRMPLPFLKDKSLYLVVRLILKEKKERYALLGIPTLLPRFLILEKEKKFSVIMLEDIIRLFLDDIFYLFHPLECEAWAMKITRDAELDIDHDLPGNYVEKISLGLKKRKKGSPVRFSYDSDMPDSILNFLIRKLSLESNDLIPQGRYLNFKDFMNFPNVPISGLRYEDNKEITHPLLVAGSSIIRKIRKKDCLLFFPFHSFDLILQFLRESAIDPKVKKIKITLYRVAQNSNIIKALVNAVRNGKEVTVVVELQARFDEEANLHWYRKMSEAGVKVIHGLPGLKIHSKMCLVERLEEGETVRYANLGTGNYHEGTARLYMDLSLFTSDISLTNEISKLFDYIVNPSTVPVFDELVVSPFNTRSVIHKAIRKEIQEVKKGRPGHIIIKVNHIVDEDMISHLFDASKKGVKIDLIVRTTCGLVAGIPQVSENIRIISIVDRYLEHARIYYFFHGGKEKLYLSSSDLMPRNLDHRIELGFPVKEEELRNLIIQFLKLQLKDNQKARRLDQGHINEFVSRGKHSVRSQEEIPAILTAMK